METYVDQLFATPGSKTYQQVSMTVQVGGRRRGGGHLKVEKEIMLGKDKWGTAVSDGTTSEI